MKWNFFYQITVASRTIDEGVGGYRPQFPVLCPLSSAEFVEPHRNIIPG